ncbi:MAG: hypothetical protein GC162_07100 [Planctomycetes bacterium]|nr:hypothetical protein [Planctomycetota bacterium]
MVRVFRHLVLLVCCFIAVAVSPMLRADEAVPAAESDAFVTLNFPENLDLKVLVDYVSKRLNLNILYDESLANQHVTLQAPSRIPVSSLLGLLESTLRVKGMALIDGDQPGWKRVVQVANLVAISGAPGNGAVGNANAVITSVFQLDHSDPTRVDTIIKPFLTQPGGNSFSVDGSKLLIVTDYASNMQRITSLIALADQPQEQVAIEFIPIAHQEAAKLLQQAMNIVRFKSQAMAGGQAKPGATAGVELTSDPRTNQIIAVGSKERVADAVKIVKSLDVSLGLSTKIYQFKVASPDRIDKLLAELIGPVDAGRLYHSAVDEEGRFLVVTATPEIHERVESLKRDMDVTPTEAESPIRFYKLQNADAADVLETLGALEGGESSSHQDSSRKQDAGDESIAGSNINQQASPTGAPAAPPQGYSNSAESAPHGLTPMSDGDASKKQGVTTVRSKRATITADVNTNSIIIIAKPDVQSIFEKLIRQLDQRRPQVLIEATVVVLDTSNDFSLGVELGQSAAIDGGRNALVFSSFGLSTINPSTAAVSLIPGVGFNGAILDTKVADLVIQALKSDSHAKVVSTPRILVNDNAKGTLDSISEEPYTSVNASTTVSTTSFSGYVKAGTTINVKPHISEGDHLTLQYAVELNSFTGKGTNGIPPPRQTTSIESHVTVPDGFTVVVGGLHRTDDSSTLDAIPFLGEVPVLKHLFQKQTDTRSDSTLFVFIRPIILRDDQFADLKFISSGQLDKAELPGDFPTSEPLVSE